MATKVFMEALSPTMEEGRLVKWIKNEGDAVKSGETLAEIETDKAIMELVARGEGVLRKRLLEEDGTAPVGSIIAVIAAPDENIDALVAGAARKATPAEAASGPPAAGGAPEAQLPRAAGGPPPQSEATPSPAASRHQTIAPASVSPRSPASPAQGAPAPSGTPAPGDGRTRSSPLARRLASERGLDVRALQGSGPGGRVIRRDIESALASGPAATGPRRQHATPVGSGPDFEDVPLTQIRKTIARRLAESLGPIPTFYLTAEYDMERVAEMRTAMAELGDEYRVSFNDIILKATASALTLHRECNAHWMGDHIRYFNRVHLGMAVAVEDGLITPVLFDADQKGLGAIAREARDLAARARERRLAPEEYTGSTFSVSNLGMFGISHFTAIINPPECGIIAVGTVEAQPVAQHGTVATRRRMRVTMSCDHRVIDGATGARFLQTLGRLIENPLLLVY
jgi:pyruvate dehydrogenase E2 component (dihydrolipoyllysine-residue acetyltransferase)